MSQYAVWPVIAVLYAMSAVGMCDDKPKAAAPAKKKEADPRIVSRVDVKPVSIPTEQESQQISFAASRIVKHVAQARAALHDNKKDEAVSHIEQGLKLVTIIGKLLPRYQVTTEIKSGDVMYQDEDHVVQDLVTLFDELDRRDIISPVQQAKREHALRHPSRKGTNDQPVATGPAYAVTHADLQYTALKLNVGLVARQLNAARKDLQEDKAQQANEALLVVQTDAVIFEYEEIDLPLKEAADNLKLAELEMKEGRLHQAKAALHIAIDQLKQYESKAGSARSVDVKVLHEEITKLTAELEKGAITPADQQKHASTISGWWQQATKWFRTNKR